MAGTWTCTEDEDHGSLGDDIVRVTGGTSGTPADFPSFVTADRAGEAVLLAATSCTTNMTLTYQIRPVEDLALQISFILSGTSAGAGDTLDITGTDWAGNAQGPETIDVSGGDGTYNGANTWRTITDIDCTGWADGTLRVTQPQWGFIWDYGGGQYHVDANLQIGDSSTSTYFASELESVYWETGVKFDVKSNAELRIGELSNGRGRAGSYWTFAPNTGSLTDILTYSQTGIFKVYASKLYIRTDDAPTFRAGTIDFQDSHFSWTTGNESAWTHTMYFYGGVSSATIKNCYYYNAHVFGVFLKIATLENIWVHEHSAAVMSQAAGMVVSGFGASQTAFVDLQVWGDSIDLTIKNPEYTVSTPYIGNNPSEDSWAKTQYTCNIHVNDKDGANLASVIVTCDISASSNYDTQEFSVSTDAGGDIAEQTIDAMRWVGTSETETDYSPMRLTLSKAGYETLVLENITVDGKIDWHIELQSQKQSPAPWQEGVM